MAERNPLAAPQPQPALDEFEIMRRRLRQRGAARGEEAQRGLQRQFAALGTLPSGAALRQQQITARETEQLTGRELQDVAILEAQTRRAEREAQAQRGLQRFGITTGAETQRGIAQLQAETQIGAEELRARTARETAQLQAETQIRERQLIEAGTSERFATQLSQNRELFDLELQLKQQNTDIQRELARFGIEQGKEEMVLNRAATVLNALDPLSALGFSSQEVGDMIETLGLPFADQIREQYAQRTARIGAEPPAERKPTFSEQMTNTLGQAPADIVNAVGEIGKSISRSIFG